MIDDCPKCEYNKNRAARWRAEAYKQAGHDAIELPWAGLTDEEYQKILVEHDGGGLILFYHLLEVKLRENNT